MKYQDWQDNENPNARVVTLAEKLEAAARARVFGGGKPSKKSDLSKRFGKLTDAEYAYYLAAIAEIDAHENQPN